jgi:hypothetical protein
MLKHGIYVCVCLYLKAQVIIFLKCSVIAFLIRSVDIIVVVEEKMRHEEKKNWQR